MLLSLFKPIVRSSDLCVVAELMAKPITTDGRGRPSLQKLICVCNGRPMVAPTQKICTYSVGEGAARPIQRFNNVGRGFTPAV